MKNITWWGAMLNEGGLVEQLARRFLLTPSLVSQARSLFDANRLSGVKDAVEAAEATALPSAAPSSSTSAETEAIMTAPSLKVFLAKMGTPMSDFDTEELIRHLRGIDLLPPVVKVRDATSPPPKEAVVATGSSAEAKPRKNRGKGAAADTEKNPGGTSAPAAAATNIDTPRTIVGALAENQTSPNEAEVPQLGSPAASTPAPLGLSFPYFLYFLLVQPEAADTSMSLVPPANNGSNSPHLLNERLSDCCIKSLFDELDCDGDGVLTAYDTHTLATRYLTADDYLFADDVNLRRLYDMHPAELQAALKELDFNRDDVVTLDDLKAAL